MSVQDLERQHFLKTVAAFKFYKTYMMKKKISQTEQYERLNSRQKELIPNFLNHLKEIENCVGCNAMFISKFLKDANSEMFEGEHFLVDQNSDVNDTKNGELNALLRFGITSNDMDKIRSTLKQFVRDWSTEGINERLESYQPVIEEVESLYKSSRRSPSDIRVLVPGSGLGRLVWEFAHRGYTCQGNEWSLYMLLPAYFILNMCKIPNEHVLFPWVSQFCNNLTRENQLASVTIPDVLPSDLPPDVQFSMVAGDFIEVYTEPDSWDCVATVFFIDTAHNILDYLETIWNILVPGGHWINLGPLLYHFAGIPGEDSIELSFSEVREAAQKLGFDIIKEEEDLSCTYTQDPRSMLQYNYRCVLTVFQKPLGVPSL